MALKLSVLFFTPLLSGFLIFLVPSGKNTSYKLLLVFAGAYLFGITVTHILPELYSKNSGVELIGLFVLVGFFLQQLLEYFTSGVEHGHMHTHADEHHHDHDHGQHHHHHRSVSALVLLGALSVHGFLEGGILAQPANMALQYDVNAILLGIALHTAPAAFALMTVLSIQLKSKNKALPYLIGFCLASPIGLLLSTNLADNEIISPGVITFLYAVVCGNFLHISTTIVFESSPDHKFNAKKLAVAIFGALVAVAVEYIL
jgi:zinc transporter ZupT